VSGLGAVHGPSCTDAPAAAAIDVVGDVALVVAAVHDRVLTIASAVWSRQGNEERHRLVTELVRTEDPLLTDAQVHAVVAEVLARTDGLGVLEPLLADPDVTEVMVNAGRDVWVERLGELERTPIILDEATVARTVERIVAPLGLRVDRSSPLVDARLPDGSRVNAIVRPLAIDGPCLTIRRFGVADIDLERFCGPGIASLLRWAVAARANLVVSGGTGSGKTTLLNAIGAHLPAHERIITIEDTAELRLPGDHIVRLESRPANSDGAGEQRIRDLVRNALRMRPDRIVVGEVRGDEALDMLQAMNTGHEGSLSTCHANSPLDALRRLETMIVLATGDLPLAAVREQIASSVDLVVQVARGSGGERFVAAVHEVAPTVAADGSLTTAPLTEGPRLARLPVRAGRRRGTPAPSSDWIGS
jgi:pilus assembly protein CpaF